MKIVSFSFLAVYGKRNVFDTGSRNTVINDLTMVTIY